MTVYNFDIITPYIIKSPPQGSCGTPDCSESKITVSKYNLEIWPHPIDLDNDGFPEYHLFLSGIGEPQNITLKQNPPQITLNGDILINKQMICYSKNNNILCTNLLNKKKVC